MDHQNHFGFLVSFFHKVIFDFNFNFPFENVNYLELTQDLKRTLFTTSKW